MDKATTSLLACIFILFSIIASSLLSNQQNDHFNIHVAPLNISSSTVLQHVSKIIEIGDAAETYDVGRSSARDYIKDTLTKGGIPTENIFYHYFEWKEIQQRNSLTWSGVNILVWLNKTAIPNQKLRVFGAHYDTFFWGNNSTSGASTLAGVALLMETAINLNKHEQQQKQLNKTYEEVPYLFVFFDHHEPGALGSKALAKELPANNIAYFIAVSSVGFQGSYPMLHTIPYDNHERSFYTPSWLASLLLRAGILHNVQVKIGGTTKAHSLLYQAYRYHWNAILQLDVDGPFAWRGVPCALLSDYDAIFEPNPHHHKPTDQVWTLKEKRITDVGKLLSTFILVSKDHPKMNAQLHEPPNIYTDIFYFVVNGWHQYIGIGAFVVGFVEIASLSFVIISVVCFNSVYQYSQIYSQEQISEENKIATESELDADSEDEDTDAPSPRSKPAPELPPPENEGGGIWQGHKILVVHMLLMSGAVLVDTVFAFEMLILSFAALSTIHFSQFYINIVTGFICSILCVNFLYKDVIIMGKFGVRTHDLRELRLVFLIFVYLLHSAMLLVYGYDYRRKKAKLKKLSQ